MFLLTGMYNPFLDLDVPLTSLQLLVAGGALLLLAGFLMAARARRKERVALERSGLSDEVIIYLGRIADALEKIAARPSPEQSLEQISERLAAKQENPGENAGAKGHATPLSMLGREL